MRKGKNLVAIGLCLAMCYVPMQAAGYYRTKKVQYGGVNLYYNGAYQNTAAQTVIIDGTTYLPVKAFGNMLGLNIDWNQASQTVMINGTTTPVLSAQAELQAKNYEIATLRKELEKLKNEGVVSSTTSTSTSTKYDTTSGTNISSSEVSDTRRSLNNEYSDYFDDIDFDFSLSLSSNKLKVTITIDSSSDYRKFNQLSRSRVKNFIEDVCEYIRDRHDDIVISGAIEYTNSSRDLYRFNYSKSDYLSYSDYNYDYDYDYDDEEDLEDIVDDTTSVQINGYSGNINVRKSSVSLSNSREYVNFNLYLDITDDMKSAWNSNKGTNNDTTLRSYLKDIARRLNTATDYEVDGTLINYSTGNTIGYYDYEDNEIYLYSIS